MKQTLAMRQRMFGTYISFLRAVRGEQYQPHGDCPRCNKKLSLVEIMKGFRNDATDYTTKCPKCKTRFEPQMILRGNYGSSVELPFFCSMQTADRLRGMEALTPEDFEKKEVATYRSAIFHFGSLAAAFRKLGIRYPHTEIDAWQKKARNFLGKLPDQMIANAVGVPVAQVSALRKAKGIPVFRKRSLVEA